MRKREKSALLDVTTTDEPHYPVTLLLPPFAHGRPCARRPGACRLRADHAAAGASAASAGKIDVGGAITEMHEVA
jgi:hypothetical protein